jgi:hypothetical protein
VGAQGLGDDLANLFLVEGLFDVVEGAELHRFDRAFHRAVGGDHDDRNVGVVDGQAFEQTHAVEDRHLEVGDHRADVATHASQGFLAVGGGHDIAAVALENGLEDTTDVDLVVRDEDALDFGVAGGHGRDVSRFLGPRQGRMMFTTESTETQRAKERAVGS